MLPVENGQTVIPAARQGRVARAGKTIIKFLIDLQLVLPADALLGIVVAKHQRQRKAPLCRRAHDGANDALSPLLRDCFPVARNVIAVEYHKIRLHRIHTGLQQPQERVAFGPHNLRVLIHFGDDCM